MNLQDNHGWTSLVWASQNGHDRVVAVLMENGASSTASMKTGISVGKFIEASMVDLDPDSKLASVLAETGLRASSR